MMALLAHGLIANPGHYHPTTVKEEAPRKEHWLSAPRADHQAAASDRFLWTIWSSILEARPYVAVQRQGDSDLEQNLYQIPNLG